MTMTPAAAPDGDLSSYRAWLQGLAMVVMLGSFFLIVVGGNVTSLDAGMAVPDWPGTFGYNMFLAPIAHWGPHSGGAFWEHSHRLIGSGVGLGAIALAIGLWFTQKDRAWLRWLGFGLLGAIIIQGLMGGFRVTENSLFLAGVHGVFGQVILGMAVVVAAATGRLWLETSGAAPAAPQHGGRWALAVFAICIGSVVAAIFLRASHGSDLNFLSRAEVAAVIGAMVVYSVVNLAKLIPAIAVAWPRGGGGEAPRLAAIMLVVFLVLQLCLGAGVRHSGAERAIPDAPLVFGGLVPPVDHTGLARAYPPPLPFITLGQVWLHYAHRVAALLVAGALVWLAVETLRRPLHPMVYPPLITTVGLTVLQVMLGVMTVWSEINPSMATLHQGTGAALLAFATLLVVRVFLAAHWRGRVRDAGTPIVAPKAGAEFGGQPA